MTGRCSCVNNTNLNKQAINIPQPHHLAERVAVAEQFGREYSLSDIPLLVDDPTVRTNRMGEPLADVFEKHFAPWPLRFYVLLNGHVVSRVICDCNVSACAITGV